MEKILCAHCGAALVPSTTQAFLTCEYCGSSATNPFYVESDAQAAAQPQLPERCVQTLLEMGERENLRDVDETCFGNPLRSATSARRAMEIPDREQVYFLYDHLTLLGTVKEALALADTGLYYYADGKAGSRSWEAFVTGPIACRDRAGWQQAGELSIGSFLTLAVDSEADSRLAAFLVDFHNHMYQLHTGQTVPPSWAVTDPAAEQTRSRSSRTIRPATLAGTAATVLTQHLLHRSAPRQTIVQRPSVVHPARKPAPPPMARVRHQPAPPMGGPGRPGMPGRSHRPGRTGRPGGPGRGRR